MLSTVRATSASGSGGRQWLRFQASSSSSTTSGSTSRHSRWPANDNDGVVALSFGDLAAAPGGASAPAWPVPERMGRRRAEEVHRQSGASGRSPGARPSAPGVVAPARVQRWRRDDAAAVAAHVHARAQRHPVSVRAPGGAVGGALAAAGDRFHRGGSGPCSCSASATLAGPPCAASTSITTSPRPGRSRGRRWRPASAGTSPRSWPAWRRPAGTRARHQRPLGVRLHRDHRPARSAKQGGVAAVHAALQVLRRGAH